MLNIIINGVNGKMGRVLKGVLESERDMCVIAGFDKEVGGSPLPFKLYTNPDDCGHGADVVIDFSHYTAVSALMDYCVRTLSPAVVATTALGEAEKAKLREAARAVPVFRTANMSLGVNVVSKMARLAMPSLERDFNVELIEKHHNQKVDSPSGTALLLANAISGACAEEKTFVYGRHGKSDVRAAGDVGIHAIRGGNIPGEHTILFLGPDEVIEIRHTIYSKDVFARGAINAARFIAGKPPGLYDMEDLVTG